MRAVVRGRVQGVYFRDFARSQGRRLGLSGYVRNLADGTVEIVAEGKNEALQILIHQLRIGPSSAEVEEVNIEWSQEQGEFSGFEIRYG